MYIWWKVRDAALPQSHLRQPLPPRWPRPQPRQEPEPGVPRLFAILPRDDPMAFLLLRNLLKLLLDNRL